MLGSLKLTIQESIRYRGRSGHYSWVAHRLSGLGILAFLVIHVWDTANANYLPGLYSWSINVFKHPIFGFGEILVFGAVLYHAFNGIRITILDFKPEWWHLQAKSATFVWALFLVLFVPAGIYLLFGIVESCAEPPVWEWLGKTVTGNSCWSLPPLDHFRPFNP